VVARHPEVERRVRGARIETARVFEGRDGLGVAPSLEQALALKQGGARIFGREGSRTLELRQRLVAAAFRGELRGLRADHEPLVRGATLVGRREAEEQEGRQEDPGGGAPH